MTVMLWDLGAEEGYQEKKKKAVKSKESMAFS